MMTGLRVRVVALAMLQAALLARAPPHQVPWLLVAQVSAGLVDWRRQPRAGSTAVALQTSLYAVSLLAPLAAAAVHPGAGGRVSRALAKTLAPLAALAAQRQRTTQRQWIAASIAYAGFVTTALTTSDAQHERIEVDGAWCAAHALLLLGTCAGVALGVAQQRAACGPCWTEMSLGATLLLAASALVAHPPAPPSVGAVALLLGHFALSLYVQRTVRAYSHAVAHDALALTATLSVRRALSVALEACTAPSHARATALLGAAAALTGAYYTNPRSVSKAS